MKRIVSIGIVCGAVAALAAGWTGPGGAKARAARADEVNLLLLVQENYGLNHNLVRDFMELYGWNLTTVAVQNPVPPCAWGGAIEADTLVSEITDLAAFDGIVVCQSRSSIADPFRQLLDSPEALALLQAADAEGKLIVAHCAGTRVLAAAGVIDGHRVTGKVSWEAEYVAAGATYVGEAGTPVRDGNIVTCMRGQVNSERVCEAMRVVLDEQRSAVR